MYSKNQGIRSRAPHPPPRREGGELGRGPSYRQRVRVPSNYSGHAIVDGLARTYDPPADTTQPSDPPPPPYTGPASPYFDDLPRVSELGASGRRPLSLPLPYEAISDDEEPRTPAEEIAEPYEDAPPAEDMAAESPAAPLAAPGPARGLFDPSHFPFGHGIGSDELILLGLIALLLYENTRSGGGRGDLDETVLLLGILLLCG